MGWEYWYKKDLENGRRQPSLSPMQGNATIMWASARIALGCRQLEMEVYLIGRGSGGLIRTRASDPQALQDSAGFPQWQGPNLMARLVAKIPNHLVLPAFITSSCAHAKKKQARGR
jgi:hypothetical protein